MLALRISSALIAAALALFAFSGCAHPNLTVRTQPGVEVAASRATVTLRSSELVRDAHVPYRPSDFYLLPLAGADEPENCPADFDLECEVESFFSAAFPAG